MINKYLPLECYFYHCGHNIFFDMYNVGFSPYQIGVSIFLLEFKVQLRAFHFRRFCQNLLLQGATIYKIIRSIFHNISDGNIPLLFFSGNYRVDCLQNLSFCLDCD